MPDQTHYVQFRYACLKPQAARKDRGLAGPANGQGEAAKAEVETIGTSELAEEVTNQLRTYDAFAYLLSSVSDTRSV